MKSDFRNLKVWQKGKQLRQSVYNLVKEFPAEEKYRLSDQMIRASRSITANIAEGYGRFHYKDSMRFYNQARGSAYELLDHLEVASECELIDADTFQKYNDQIQEIIALNNGFVKHLRNKVHKQIN
jgi:four helix bundle protein